MQRYPHEELFITTKVWPNHFGFEKTRTAVETSLEKLGLGYIDLYLLHVMLGVIRRKEQLEKASESLYKELFMS